MVYTLCVAYTLHTLRYCHYHLYHHRLTFARRANIKQINPHLALYFEAV
jgi:hypothetical protein